MQYLLGIDLGAGSLKATVMTDAGAVAGAASCAITTASPHFGWAEQDPAAWLAAMAAAVPAAIREAGIRASAIAGVGVSAGAHIPVLVDAAGDVIRPAILWSDQRAVAEAAALHAAAGEMIIRLGLNRVNPTWTLAMLAWLRAHEPAAVARVRRLYLAKDYLRHWLTGSWETDYSDAVGTLLVDDTAKTWSADICKLIGWDMSTLPPIRPAAAVVGCVPAAAAAAYGLAAGTPVVCGANDTTVEFFGAGGLRPGMAAIKLATAGVVYVATEGPRVRPPVSCYPHIVDGLYYAATGTNSCASAHRWLRDTMFAAGGFAEMEALAATVPAGAGGLLFHPYLQGERAPYWDPLLRGDFIGLTIAHDRSHFARALYEGIAFSLADALQAARSLGFQINTARLLGGGAKSATWRQILADVTGVEIEVIESGDASVASAMLAGLGVGIFNGAEDAVARCVRVTDICRPDAGANEFYGRLFDIYKAAQAGLTTVNHRLHEITR